MTSCQHVDLGQGIGFSPHCRRFLLSDLSLSCEFAGLCTGRCITSSASESFATAMAKARSLVNRGTERTDTARPPMSAHRTFRASRSATALRSADSTGEAMTFPRRQAQPRVRRRHDQPSPDEVIDICAAGERVLAVHPLPVQLDAEFVHFQRGTHALGFGSPVKGTGLCCWAQSSESREQSPESARPTHTSMISAVDELGLDAGKDRQLRTSSGSATSQL